MLGIVKTFLVTTPNIFKKPWLACPDDELLPFVHELTVYCRNNDIDPSDYIGDWFPLAITGVAVGAGVLSRHRAHKKEGNHIESKATKDFDSKAGFAEEYDPVTKKGTEYDQSSGTNLPENEETELTEIMEENDDEPTTGHNKGDGAFAAEETADSEPSERIL